MTKLTDKFVENFDYSPDDDTGVDIVAELNRLYRTIKEHAAEQAERHRDPNWQLRDVHIASREIADVLSNPKTPIDVKAYLLMSTYAGQYWFHDADDDDDRITA